MGSKKTKRRKAAVTQAPRLRLSDRLRLPEGPVDLAALSTSATVGFDGDKADGKAALVALDDELSELQEKLFAHGRSGGERSLLLVLQGMDTAGKGGAVRHAVALMDPQGLAHTAFKAPTREELRHDFLWRIRRRLPRAGMVGVFDRSHYEDVVVAKVKSLSPPAAIGRRYAAINRFEESLATSGTTVVKVMLHISKDEQRDRLLTRLDRTDKYWKYRPGDIDDRALWEDYQRAYEIALERCNTDIAPWHVVPSDHKWYRNWAVAMLLLEALREMALDWPPADFDIELERGRVLAT